MRTNRILLFSSLLGMSFLLASCQQPETTSPTRKDIEEAVFASGYIEQENNYTVSAKVDGIIISLPIKEGDFVGKNALIALVENDVQNNKLEDALAVYEDAVRNASPHSPQLQNLQTQINQAKQQLEHDEANYLRYKELRKKNSVSQLEFEINELQYKASQNNLLALQKQYKEVKAGLDLNVERSRVQVSTQKSLLKDYRLLTEEAGQVIHVFKERGELVRQGEAIAHIGSGDFVIKLLVAEEDITRTSVGQPVAIHLNTYPKDTFRAKVTKIYPGFDETEQSYILEAQFEELPEKMFSGTQLQANIETNKRAQVLVIPTNYISRGSFVQLENGEEKQIVTGSKNSDWTEVVSGISEGEIIVKPTD